MRQRATDVVLSAAIGVVVLGPLLLRRGFALRGDMVLVPHQPWKDSWLGLDGSAPRFVPGDAILSTLTTVLPGDLLQKALLLAALVLGGVGAGRLVADRSALGRAAAILLFLWNPWVLERLSIGQWGSVVGYAALPYVVVAAAAARDRRHWPPLVLWMAFCALWSPAAGLVGALTAFCIVVVGRDRRQSLATVGIAVLVNVPWLVPSVLGADRISSPGDQFEAFSARGESAAGLLPSLLSLGGIWKASVVPEERTLALVVVLSCVTTAVALVAGRGTRERPGLLLLAGVAFLLALVPALPGLSGLLDSATDHAPGLAALRDGHRYLGPAVLVLLPGIAAAVELVWAKGRRGREAIRAAAVVLALLPALCLPSLMWGLNGDLRPVTYPGEWFAVADVVADDLDERGGATVVLPWHGTYRGFAWNDDRAMLDPAPRFFEGEVLIDDRIFLSDRVLDNEDPELAEVTAALAEADPAAALSGLGVTRVLVEKGNGVIADEVPEGAVLHDGRNLTLISLDGAPGSHVPTDRRRALVIAADLLLLVICGYAGFAAWTNRRRPGVG